MAKQAGLTSGPECQCPPARDHQDHLELNSVGLPTRANPHCGEPWGISVRGYDRELTGARLGLGDVGEGSERQDFALDWVLSEAGVILWVS